MGHTVTSNIKGIQRDPPYHNWRDSKYDDVRESTAITGSAPTYIIAETILYFGKHERYNIINKFSKQWCLYSIDTPNEYRKNISHW